MFQSLTDRILKPPAFGLDISDITVKFCKAIEHKGSLLLDAFGEIDIPEGIIIGGEVLKPEELIRILKEKLHTQGGKQIRDRYCIASLPEEKSFVRVIDLPELKEADAEKAIRWEVEGVIPLPGDQITFDYEPLQVESKAKGGAKVVSVQEIERGAQGPKQSRSVLLTAFPKEFVETYERVLREAGYIPLALELESQAISRALIPDASHQKPIIIVDIGATRTSFIIFAGGSLVFTKSITTGGRDFEVAISKSLGIPIEEARKVKIEAGLNKNFREGKVFEALSPHILAMTNELDQQITFYENHPARQGDSLGEIHEILLCGGDANLIGLEKFIATAVRKETVLGDPFCNFQFREGAVPPIPKAKALKYTTAIGLALRAVGH